LTIVDSSLFTALTGYIPSLAPEAILGVVACVLFLGGTWRPSRRLWGLVALLGLAGAGFTLWASSDWAPTMESLRDQIARQEERLATLVMPHERAAEETALEKNKLTLHTMTYASPIQHTRLAILIKVLALVGGVILVLFSWNDMPANQASDYHGCLLIMLAGVCLIGASNEMITLFLALEMVSIPTYIMLYLPRQDSAVQEAAMKYFLISVFSSALTLFGFSYLYGVAGTTNLPAMAEALAIGRATAPLPGVVLVALVMVVAGLGFRITAVPFHFYAPDVYQGTTTGMAALLAFIPKVAGFMALIRLLGFVPPILVPGVDSAPLASLAFTGQSMGEQAPVLLWIMAAVTMTLGNLLGLLQDNIKRMLAYSSVAHAGYMLIGLAVAPKLASGPGAPVGGVEAVLFYLMAYGAMTIGAFGVLNYLSTPERPVETIDELAGLGRSRPGLALVMVLFLFSLIGMPLTAGFAGKLMLFFGAMGAPFQEDSPALLEQARLYRILALIAVLNAAIGAWFYLRIAVYMYLREPIQTEWPARSTPGFLAIALCALVTLGAGVYPGPLVRAIQNAVPHVTDALPTTHRAAQHQVDGPAVARGD
jgi:NADH-quinone oxidoreductase subunit N